MIKETYYCANCFKDFDIDVTAICEAANTIKEFKESPYSLINIQVGCPHCKELATFQADKKMVPIIRFLNENGYNTIAHCSGHLERSPFHFISTNESSTYIAIRTTMKEIQQIKQIPKPDTLDINFTGFENHFVMIDAIEREPDVDFYYSVDIYYKLKVNTEKDIDEAMTTIFDYVSQFPKSNNFSRGSFISPIMEEDLYE